jgi:hypothetical protein
MERKEIQKTVKITNLNFFLPPSTHLNKSAHIDIPCNEGLGHRFREIVQRLSFNGDLIYQIIRIRSVFRYRIV